jgi:hypothetical protein
MDIQYFIEDISEQVQNYVNENMEEVFLNETKIGLDPRASYAPIFINRSAIAVKKSYDRNMQYYGGFEYVYKEYRHEMGDYVFYLAEDDRVGGHIDSYYEQKEEVE